LSPAGARVALFDFDGTLSLIRTGWQQVMVPMMVEILRECSGTEDPAAIRCEILAGAAEAGAAAQVVEIGDRREAIDHAVAWAAAGDVVVIAGKGHETGQTRGGHTHPFDDRVELAAALEERRT